MYEGSRIREAPAVLPRLLTRRDYLELPEDGPRYQLIQGELFMAPAPNRFHQHISGNIEYALRRYLEDHPIGLLYDAPFDVTLTDINVFQPDILFVSNERKSLFDQHGLEGPPDLVIEILSPGTAKLDLDPKRKVYAQTGVQELWIVDPQVPEFRLFRLQENAESPFATLQAGAFLESPIFPGLQLDIGKALQMD